MKKTNIITISCCLLLAPLCSCGKSGQPESNFYKISFVNLADDTDVPPITFENSNLIKKGKDCDLLIRLDPLAKLNPLYGEEGSEYEIREANFKGNGAVLNPSCYSVTATDTPHVYNLKIPKEYMTTSYEVNVNCTYLTSNYTIVPDTGIEDEITIETTNLSSKYDLTFIIMPNNAEAGATFDGETKDAIQIYGVKDNEEKPLELSRKELVHIDRTIQGVSHYRTHAMSLRVAIPMEELYDTSTTTESGYAPKFDKIEVSSTLVDGHAVTYDVDHYKTIFNPQTDGTCKFEKADITFEEDDEKYYAHYKATFSAISGYKFHEATNDEEDFPITDLTAISDIYTPTGHPYFRNFILHKDSTERENIQLSPFEAYKGIDDGYLYYYLLGGYVPDTLGNIYVPMKDWLAYESLNNGNGATIDINITKMVKYVQLPTSTIIALTDIGLLGEYYYTFYSGGSIDFIKSFNFTVSAANE
ncbi:MAG: hypothetical protein MJ208_01605 [Bacilli bacterium]|nr:hypothetical protein [Bacilli bacterium]